jgi:hypothetical protein
LQYSSQLQKEKIAKAELMILRKRRCLEKRFAIPAEITALMEANSSSQKTLIFKRRQHANHMLY